MKIKLSFLYKAPDKKDIPLETGWFEDGLLEAIVNDFSKVGRIKEIVVCDEMETEWSLKEQKGKEKNGGKSAKPGHLFRWGLS
jgi:TolB-like protein